MKFADSHLILLASSKLLASFRFSESRSYLACHHTRLLRNLSTFIPGLNVDYSMAHGVQAVFTLTHPFWYGLSWASTAQIVRAILFANATITTFNGRRFFICSTHEPGSFA